MVLTVYVDSHCPNCAYVAPLLASMAERFPTVTLEQVNIELQPERKPPEVFAIPTYYLNGRRLCLGNPEEDWLVARVAEQAAQEQR